MWIRLGFMEFLWGRDGRSKTIDMPLYLDQDNDGSFQIIGIYSQVMIYFNIIWVYQKVSLAQIRNLWLQGFYIDS